MLEVLRDWLNGSREFFSGVAIYQVLGSDVSLKKVLATNKSEYLQRRLETALLELFETKNESRPANEESTPEPETDASNELFKACRHDADRAYKQVMNERAILFAAADPLATAEPNLPHLVAARTIQALRVVSGFNEVSRLYDRVDYVRQHARLPDAPSKDNHMVDELPDHLVKQALDNARKNVNKLKKRLTTPERLQLIQDHENRIEKLLFRWNQIKVQQSCPEGIPPQ